MEESCHLLLLLNTKIIIEVDSIGPSKKQKAELLKIPIIGEKIFEKC